MPVSPTMSAEFFALCASCLMFLPSGQAQTWPVPPKASTQLLGTVWKVFFVISAAAATRMAGQVFVPFSLLQHLLSHSLALQILNNCIMFCHKSRKHEEGLDEFIKLYLVWYGRWRRA